MCGTTEPRETVAPTGKSLTFASGPPECRDHVDASCIAHAFEERRCADRPETSSARSPPPDPSSGVARRVHDEGHVDIGVVVALAQTTRRQPARHREQAIGQSSFPARFVRRHELGRSTVRVGAWAQQPCTNGRRQRYDGDCHDGCGARWYPGRRNRRTCASRVSRRCGVRIRLQNQMRDDVRVGRSRAAGRALVPPLDARHRQ